MIDKGIPSTKKHTKRRRNYPPPGRFLSLCVELYSQTAGAKEVCIPLLYHQIYRPTVKNPDRLSTPSNREVSF